jgi:hypothetical protein
MQVHELGVCAGFARKFLSLSIVADAKTEQAASFRRLVGS